MAATATTEPYNETLAIALAVLGPVLLLGAIIALSVAKQRGYTDHHKLFLSFPFFVLSIATGVGLLYVAYLDSTPASEEEWLTIVGWIYVVLFGGGFLSIIIGASGIKAPFGKMKRERSFEILGRGQRNIMEGEQHFGEFSGNTNIYSTY